MRFPTSSVEATVHCLVLASLFVVSLYAWNLTGRPQYDRNHPIQVKRRLKSVAAACFLSPIYLIFVSTRSSFESDQPSPTLATWLGLSTSKLIESVVLSLFLTATAFLGPLCLEDKLPTPSNLRRIQLSQFSDIFFLRNVIVAPIAEEFVYRGCLVPLLWSAGFTFNQIVFWCPLFFGVAHLHHILQNISHGWNALKIAILQALFQTLYTWVFGMYSTFLFLRTGTPSLAILLKLL
eukprot:TRINITY_DN5187_c0_g1_i2.p1 TRINITY_DN5187_c0_g1~~TRINITY_DN5187_c0_g1_i2.p1  ORF type:complete len:236 (+),score=31.90 TRINITY_DN5187_c0_g1_i2:57-764(+)